MVNILMNLPVAQTDIDLKKHGTEATNSMGNSSGHSECK